MQHSSNPCSKLVAARLECSVCRGLCKKHGKTANLKQRYQCTNCKKTFINLYTYNAYKRDTTEWIKNLLKEGSGIRSIGRLLLISNTTVLKRILAVAKATTKPVKFLHKSYEVDEVCTYYKNKGRKIWIVYALQKDNNQVVDFAVGSRTKKTLQRVTDTLILSKAETIFTDKLNLYSFLIPKAMHKTPQYGTNRIERKNLSLRTHLKRLNRRTICFSKSILFLTACLQIYFWG